MAECVSTTYRKLMDEAKREYDEMMQKERLFVSPKKLLDYFAPVEEDEPDDQEPPRDER